jgi:excisionase family DNA binding protein
MMVNAPASEFITTSHAARLLELSENRVRQLSDNGELPCQRAGALRLFEVADVLKLRDRRDGGGAR